jgi:hypothetical protein
MLNSKREKFPAEVEDRRRTPRVSCGGSAKLIVLPFEGLTVPAQVLNLSLGGCRIKTDLPLQDESRAEILVCVNGSSFRAACEVRACGPPHSVGLEFLHLSALGRDMLTELIRDLATQRAIARTFMTAQRDPDPKPWSARRVALFNPSVPVIGNGADSGSREENSFLVDRVSLILDRDLDLFI